MYVKVEKSLWLHTYTIPWKRQDGYCVRPIWSYIMASGSPSLLTLSNNIVDSEYFFNRFLSAGLFYRYNCAAMAEPLQWEVYIQNDSVISDSISSNDNAM